MQLKGVLLGAAAIGGALLVGGCVYWDNRRRGHPDHRKNLREKRRAARMAKKENVKAVTRPDLSDRSNVIRYLLSELVEADAAFTRGDLNVAIEKYATVLSFGGPSQAFWCQLILDKTGNQVYYAVLARVDEIREEIWSSQMLKYGVPVCGGRLRFNPWAASLVGALHESRARQARPSA